jgi:hypothetical protein
MRSKNINSHLLTTNRVTITGRDVISMLGFVRAVGTGEAVATTAVWKDQKQSFCIKILCITITTKIFWTVLEPLNLGKRDM